MNEQILRSHFGFNDPNVIKGILNDPNQVSRYTREYGGGSSSPSPSSGGTGTTDIGGILKASQDRQDALVNQQKTDLTNRFNQNKADVTDFQTRYNAAVPGLYNATESKYDVPYWRTTANAIGNRIDELRGNTNNAGAGGYASADQVDKGISSNYIPRYAQATNTANTAEGLAQNEYSAKIAPFQTEEKLLTDRLSRESTGYSAQQQSELDALIKSISSGAQLTASQMDQATKLAEQENQKLIAEEGYQNKIQQTKLVNERVRSLGKYGGTYIDENGMEHSVPGVGSGTGTGSGDVLVPPNNMSTPNGPVNGPTGIDWSKYISK